MEEKNFQEQVEQVINTPDTTAEYDAGDINNNKIMAILAYIGILVLVPIFAAKESKFARFHANQGLVLLIAEVAVSIILSIVGAILILILPILGIVFSIVSWVAYVVFLVLAVMGIVNAATGKAKELPLIGSIKILK